MSPESTADDETDRLDQSTRIDATEQRLDRLEKTLKAVTREVPEISVKGPCGECGECFLIERNGLLYCPVCGDGGSI